MALLNDTMNNCSNPEQLSEQQSLHFQLRSFAGIQNNLGCLLIQEGDLLTAMQILQQSVQVLMLIEDPANETLPAEEHKEAMLNKLKEVTKARRSDILRCSSVKEDERTKQSDNHEKESPHAEESQESENKLKEPEQDVKQNQPMVTFTELKPRKFALPGIPGLFGMTSSMKGSQDSSEGFSMLTFSEPFLVDLPGEDYREVMEPLDDVFYISLDQCAKASLFNMGLIHYQWKSIDSALHFFELSMSLSKLQTDLSFDPIRIAGINNVGQILLQKRKEAGAEEMFKDAFLRGRRALDLMEEKGGQECTTLGPIVKKFLARCLMNSSWGSFFNCNYKDCMEPLNESYALLGDAIEDIESAALLYNMGLARHHNKERKESLDNLKKFLRLAYGIVGIKHEQVAAAFHRISLLFLERGNVYRAISPILIAIRIRKGLFGHFHPLVAESLSLFGKIYLDREEYDFATSAFLQALEAQRGLEGMSLDIAQTLIDLGRAHHAQGLLAESLKAYLEVLLLTKKVFGEKHVYAARIQNIIGNVYLEQDKLPEAICMFTEAMRIHLVYGIPLETKVVQNPLYRVQLHHYPAAGFA